jgi:hypothetical protein
MNNKEFLREFEITLNTMKRIVKAKNADYSNGDAFKNFKMCEKLGLCSVGQGILVRLSDKLSRVANLIDGSQPAVLDEKIEDTLLDLSNYSIILLLYLRHKDE